MIFNSVVFLIGFLPVFMVCYYLAPVRARVAVLFVGSLFFYAFGEPFYVLYLMFSMVFNYLLGKGISPNSKLHAGIKKILFFFSMVINIAILVLFKWQPEGLDLPLGISFFTFQVLSYLIDLYQGRIQKEPDFVKLCTYICMFPQLVAGPIVLYEEIEDALYHPRMTKEGLQRGILDFIHGLVLKVLFADRLSLLWNELSTMGYMSMTTSVAWIGAISYSLQIYFDFYGYSRMAIGLGEMLGFRLPENFHVPYASRSIREFYRRWHMTLNRWFMRYVYIPLGGNRKGLVRSILNLAIVWFLTSIWHGMGLHFLLWGMILFLMIVIEKCVRAWNENRSFVAMAKSTKSVIEQKHQKKNRVAEVCLEIFQHIYVLVVIAISWICFAIEKMDQLGIYLSRMFCLSKSTGLGDFFLSRLLSKYGIYLGIGILLATPFAEKWIEKGKNTWFGKIVAVVLLWLCVDAILKMGNNPFLYFRF